MKSEEQIEYNSGGFAVISRDTVKEIKLEAYREGLKEGLYRFAWWREGKQFVGTCGTTLAKALEEADKDAPMV